MIAIGFDFLVTTAIRFLCRRFATENEAILAEFLTKTIDQSNSVPLFALGTLLLAKEELKCSSH